MATAAMRIEGSSPRPAFARRPEKIMAATTHTTSAASRSTTCLRLHRMQLLNSDVMAKLYWAKILAPFEMKRRVIRNGARFSRATLVANELVFKLWHNRELPNGELSRLNQRPIQMP